MIHIRKKTRRLLALLQLVAGLTVVVILIWRLDNRKALLDNWRAALNSPGWIFAGIVFLGLSMFTTAWRWHTIVRIRHKSLSLLDANAITLSGHLFNLVLPGATGGDIIRAAYAAKVSPGERAEIASTVLLDRLIGVLSIILMTNIIVLLRLKFFMASPLLKSVAIFFFILLIAGITGTTLIIGMNHLERHPRLRSFLQRSRIGSLAARIYEALHLAFRNPGSMLSCVFLSVICQLFQVSCAWCMSCAIATGLRWPDFAAIMPVVNTAAMVPISPGGLGLREAVMQELFGAAGTPHATAISISLLVYGCMLLWAVIGIIPFLWLVFRKNAQT